MRNKLDFKFTCRKYARENLLVRPPGVLYRNLIWNSFVIDGICWLIMKAVMSILLNHPLAKTSLEKIHYTKRTIQVYRVKKVFYAFIKRSRNRIIIIHFKIVYKIAEIRQTLSARKEAIGFFGLKIKLRWRYIYLSGGRVQYIRCILYPLPDLLHTVFHLKMAFYYGWGEGGER